MSRRPGRRPLLAVGATLALLSLLAAGCSGRRPAEPRRGATERGIASWYGHPFHGRATASGEIYDMHRLTAAHKTLPFGTRVEVRNLDNGRAVEVVITDRGPFVRRRIIDVSRAAAEELEMVGPGTARVEIRVLGRRETAVRTAARDGAAPAYVVQVGAFRDPDRAAALHRQLRPRYPQVAVASDELWHRVQIGPFDRLSQAEGVARLLTAEGLAGWVRGVPAPPLRGRPATP